MFEFRVIQTLQSCTSYLIIRHGLVLRRPPAEGIEHVEEGDGDVDKDDQGEQGILKIILIHYFSVKFYDIVLKIS